MPPVLYFDFDFLPSRGSEEEAFPWWWVVLYVTMHEEGWPQWKWFALHQNIFLISMSWVIYLFADKLANWHNGTLKLQIQNLIPWVKTNNFVSVLYNMDSSMIWCLGKPDFVTTCSCWDYVGNMYLVELFHASGFLKILH